MTDLKHRIASLEARRRHRRGEWLVAIDGETPEAEIAAAIARGASIVLVQYVEAPPDKASVGDHELVSSAHGMSRIPHEPYCRHR